MFKDLSHGYWYGGKWYEFLADATKVAEDEHPSGEGDYKYAMLHLEL